MRNLIVEVRSIRRCEGGHTCNLIANGRKVAFIGPDIFEWSNHSQMVDVLEWYAAKAGSEINDKPVKLEEGWEKKVPDHKNSRYEDTQQKLAAWIDLHFRAYEIKQRCKDYVLCLDDFGDFFQFDFSPSTMPPRLWENIKLNKWLCLNHLDSGEIVSTLAKNKRLPSLP
jgi:hypothetical protein